MMPTILKLSPRRTTLPSAQYTAAVQISFVTSSVTSTAPCATPAGLGVPPSSMFRTPALCILIRLSSDMSRSSYTLGLTQPPNKLEGAASLTAVHQSYNSLNRNCNPAVLPIIRSTPLRMPVNVGANCRIL